MNNTRIYQTDKLCLNSKYKKSQLFNTINLDVLNGWLFVFESVCCVKAIK